MRTKLTFALLTIAACAKQEAPPPSVYQAVPVERRDIIVSARASGTIQPDTTVEVKSSPGRSCTKTQTPPAGIRM